MIDLTGRIKTGLLSAGISGIMGFDNVTESRTFFMTISDLYTYSIDPNTGQSRYALNKAVKLGDTIYLYDGTSIFTLSQPEAIDFGDSDNATGINILAKIKITPEILAMTYDEFQLKFRDISKSTDLEAFSRTRVINNTNQDGSASPDVFTQDKNIIIGESIIGTTEADNDKSYVVDYICKTKFSESADLNAFSFDPDVMSLNSGDSSIEIGPTKLSAEKTTLCFNCPIDITSKTLDRDFIDFRSLEGADIKINSRIDNKSLTLQLNIGQSYNPKDFVLAVLNERNGEILKYQFDNDKEYVISNIQEDKQVNFWLEYYTSFGKISVRRYCQLHQIEFERKGTSVKTKKITKIDFEKNSSLKVLDAIKNPSDLYLTFDRVQGPDFYKGTISSKNPISDSDLSVIHVALEKNKHKIETQDISNIIIDGVSFNTAESDGEITINNPKCYNSQIYKIVTKSDKNIFSANIYINYDELKEYKTIKGYYEKIAGTKGVKYPLNINDITIGFVIGDKKYDYVIPGYQDYIVNNDYLIKPSISTNTEIEYVNDFNCKNGFVNSLIMPYSVALDRLDVERLKSNGVTSVELDVVINDFVKLYTGFDTDDTISPAHREDTQSNKDELGVIFKPLVVQEANLTEESNRYSNSNDSYGYQGSIKFGLIDLDSYLKTYPALRDKRRYVNRLASTKLDTPFEPVVRAINNRQSSTHALVQIDDQTKLPLTSFSVKFDLSKVDNYNFKKDFCIYLEFDNPIPSKVILNPHIAQIKFYFGPTSEDNLNVGWTRKLYEETTAIEADKSTSNKRIVDNKFVATSKPLSFNIFPIALTAAYTKQEDVDGLTDIRIDTNTRRVVGPAEKIKLSLYPLYPEEKDQVNTAVLKSLLTDVLKKSEFTAALNVLNIKSSHPVLKVAYNKFPLLPYNDSENETVEYNKKQYKSVNYAQVNQNNPIFYPVDLNYNILEDKKFEIKNKWLNEFNFLKSNNLLEGNIDLKGDYIVQSKSNGLMFLKDILDSTNELSGIKALVNQELFINQEAHNYLDCELDSKNPLYLDKNIIPKDLFRAPLWDIRWEIPIKDDKSHDVIRFEGLDSSFDDARIKYHYANFFQMNSRILESNYPDEILVLCLRRPTIGSDNLYEDPKNSMRYYFKATSYTEDKYEHSVEYISGGLDCPDIDF